MIGLSGAALAQPSLISVSGTLEQGQSLSLGGSGFGSPMYTPISWDDFEGGLSGQPLGAAAMGEGWSFLSQEPMPSYTTQRSVSGSQSAHITWQSYSISSFGWSGQGPFRSMYVSFWRYMDPAQPSVLPDNMKLMYIYGNNTPEFMIGAIMPTRGNWQYAVQPSPTVNIRWDVSHHYTTTNNHWQRWEVYVELESSANASDGRIKGWLDGELVYDHDGLDLCSEDGRFEDIKIGHMFQGHTADDHCFYDDVYIGQSMARVELGNAPQFENCTVRHVQPPLDWNDGAVQVEFNPGSFSAGSQAYLFVVDEEGRASDGLAVTLGGVVDPGAPGEPGEPNRLP